MKKLLVYLLVLVFCMSLLDGCGNAVESDSPAEVSGETYSSGVFSVLVPNGWEEFAWYNTGSGETNPRTVGVYNGDPEDYKNGLIRGLEISYLRNGSPPAKSSYTDPEDMEPIEIGNHTWEGFMAYQDDFRGEFHPLTVIWTKVENNLIQIACYAPKGAMDEVTHIDLNDPEIVAIISSIVPD